MLPDIVKPSKIQKSVQVAFGGLDLRPDAADGTFAKTLNMTSDLFPLVASRAERMVPYLTARESADTAISNRITIGDKCIFYSDYFLRYGDCWREGGAFVMHKLGTTALRSIERLVPFGYKIVIPKTRQIVDLTNIPKGYCVDVSELPNNAEEGDVWVVNQASPPIHFHFYQYESGSWTDKGPTMQDLEKQIDALAVIFQSGTFEGEPAVNNTIAINPSLYIDDNGDEDWSECPKFSDYFKPGDAVKINSGIPEFDQTLIIREVSDREMRFYEHSFPDYVGRHVVSLPVGPGLYEVVGWDRFEPVSDNDPRPKKYFVIPSGTTLTKGMYIDYNYQESYLNPDSTVQTPEASVDLYQADGTRITGVTVQLYGAYSSALYPDGPTRLDFAKVDRGKDLYFGRLETSISKTWPKGVQGVFASNNRLWGWVGHTIVASKLGDPSNWSFFDGTSEDSWAVDVHDPDNFTGGIELNGYPTFFTENKRYQVYGGEPAAFSLGELNCNGVMAGCDKSMAMVDGALYYVSPIGVMRDTGNGPECISQALGYLRLFNATGGGQRQRYYVTGADRDGALHNLVYDVRNGVWIDEGNKKIKSYSPVFEYMTMVEDLQVEGIGDMLWMWAFFSDGSRRVRYYDETINSELVTNDYTMNQPNRKRVHRVQLRFVIGSGASLAVSIQYDGDGVWNAIKTISGDAKKKSVYLPVLPRRCDHFRLKFSGVGDWKLYSLALDLRQGSAMF